MSQVTSSAKAKVTTPSDEEILIVREFDAPKSLVYKAYTTPELVSRWWPGRRGEMTSAEIDLRPGGRWRYVMVAQGGFEVAFRGEYREVTPTERLVNTEIFEGLPDPDEHPSLVTTTFTEKDGRTYLEMLCDYRDRTDRDAVINSGMEGGMQESLDALERVAVTLA